LHAKDENRRANRVNLECLIDGVKRSLELHLIDASDVFEEPHVSRRRLFSNSWSLFVSAGRGLDASLAAALLANRPDRRATQALQLALGVADQAPILSTAQKRGSP
jgi:hypothetical protein